jgi:hypothetical protein
MVNMTESLGTLYSELTSEWSATLNTKTPYEVTPDSSYRAIWLCPLNPCGHHLFRQEVRMRVAFLLSPAKESACPYCSGILICECNSVSRLRPDLMTEWDKEQNDGKDPKELSTSSTLRVAWKCSRSGCNHHRWYASISTRAKGKGNCPYCARHKSCECDTVVSNYPDLLDSWDWDRNGTLNPYKLHQNSSVVVAWICRARGCDHHRWSSPINRRIRYGKITNCPYCKHSGKGKCCECDSLGKLHSELLEDWDFEANGEIDPFAIPPLSQKIAHWKCHKGHRWICPIEKRIGIDRGSCPFCLVEREEPEMIEDFLLSDDERNQELK